MEKSIGSRERIKISEIDLPFLSLVLLILSFGLIMLYSASYAIAYYEEGNSNQYIVEQLVFAAVGIVVMLVASRFDYHLLRPFATILFVVSTGLLLACFLFPAQNGVQRWIRIGAIGTFHPSEITKFAIVLLFAHWISKYQDSMHTFKYGVAPYISVLALTGFIMINQPHLSGTVIVLMIGVVLMFVGGTHLKYFIFAGIGGVLGLSVMLAFIDDLIPYAMTRIEIWQDPFIDPQGSSYQTIQSMLAIGSGGIFGLGLGNSRQKHLYLPEPQNDFIFAVICEELGFVGAFFVMFLFMLLLIRGIMIAVNARDKFGALLVIGIITQVTGQALLNIAVATNTIPNTGISLPFFSSGGTSLLMSLAEMGVVLSVSRQSRLTKN